MTFQHFAQRPETLDSDFLSQQFDALVARMADAENSETIDNWKQLFHDWNELKAYISGEASRRMFRLAKNLNDSEAEDSMREFREQFSPVISKGNAALIKGILSSNHKAALGAHYGDHLLTVLDNAQGPMDPMNSDLRILEGEYSTDYDKLRASAEVEVQGEKITLAVAKGHITSDNGPLRQAAYKAYRQWFLDNRDGFATIFDKLVKNRHQQAQRLGHDNFIPLGYEGMQRLDYGPDDVVQFRKGVKKYLTPIYQALMAKQAKALGTPTLAPWDLKYDPNLNLPSGVAKPVGSQLDKAERVFEKLSPKLSKHFKRMRAENLIDLENRKGKGPGAFCTSFADEKRMAIFCNSVGDMDDVATLMHEMGHAFQGWESMWIDPIELRSPSYDACEIHSTGMEFLSQKHLDEFFEAAHVEKFQRWRWRDAIQLICYCCCVDEFQHWVYANPNASFDERDQEWNRLYDHYIQGMDWSGAEQYKAARWYAQLHIFKYPFYYIDYAIAELGSMQLALVASKDHDEAMTKYLELCRLGGTKSVLKLFDSAGLRSPFDPALMKDLMSHAEVILGLE